MADATGYIVNATSASGHKVSYSSASANCTLTDLLCSETYTATIVAQGSQCDSSPGPSTNITTGQWVHGCERKGTPLFFPPPKTLFFKSVSCAFLFPAPCPPSVISKQYNCSTNTAVFRWTDPAGSLSFRGQLGGEGYQDSCQTTNTSCVFHNLPCDLDFNVTVQAQGLHCPSVPSVSESLKTGNYSIGVLLMNKQASFQHGSIPHCTDSDSKCARWQHLKKVSWCLLCLSMHCHSYFILLFPRPSTLCPAECERHSWLFQSLSPGDVGRKPQCRGIQHDSDPTGRTHTTLSHQHDHVSNTWHRLWWNLHDQGHTVLWDMHRKPQRNFKLQCRCRKTW